MPERRRAPGSQASVAPQPAMGRQTHPPLSRRATTAAGAIKPNSWRSSAHSSHRGNPVLSLTYRALHQHHPPTPDGFVGDVEPPLGEEFLDVPLDVPITQR